MIQKHEIPKLLKAIKNYPPDCAEMYISSEGISDLYRASEVLSEKPQLVKFG